MQEQKSPGKEALKSAYSYTLNFMGYITEDEIHNLPDSSGVFCVYEASRPDHSPGMVMERLLYIGEAGNLRNRLLNCEHMSVWQFSVKAKNRLAFSYALIDSFNRLRVNAALVFYHKPPFNKEYLENFPFHPTIVRSRGETSLLDTMFSVARK
ncbi:MAG: hypothetical protein FMNOHCHN_00599 [Ignavibacteriaceae bacterium]|nr:hypothetical protein [Ignavibacteriaceae bacterium]